MPSWPLATFTHCRSQIRTKDPWATSCLLRQGQDRGHVLYSSCTPYIHTISKHRTVEPLDKRPISILKLRGCFLMPLTLFRIRASPAQGLEVKEPCQLHRPQPKVLNSVKSAILAARQTLGHSLLGWSQGEKNPLAVDPGWSPGEPHGCRGPR